MVSKIEDRSINIDVVNKFRNRRACLRIPVTIIGRVATDDLNTIQEVYVLDISIYGMGGYSNFLYQKGEMLLVKLKLTLFSNEVIEASIKGTVRWSTEIDKGKRCAFGLEFRDMEKQQPRLYACLRELREIYQQELEEMLNVNYLDWFSDN